MNKALLGFFDRPSVQKQKKTASSNCGQIKADIASGKTLSVLTIQVWF